jgi:DNA-binding winged helix-turn-helix (wHTH) protein
MAGREISLTPIEYNLLSYLTKHVGRVLTHYQLLDAVWGGEYVNEQQLLRVNINRLRHKLEPNFAYPSYILTKAGIGYMLAAHPQQVSDQVEVEAQPREEAPAQALPFLCNACRKIVSLKEKRVGRLLSNEIRGNKRVL